MAATTIFFFTGENDFSLTQELIRWKAEFSAKHGPENLLILTGKELTLTKLLDAIAVAPFIAEKRLVIVQGLPKFEKEDVASITDVIHPQTILVFADPKPDKRLTVTKELQKIATMKEWKPFTSRELNAWMNEVAGQYKVRLDPQAAQFLIDFIGTDPWMLSTEIRKLAVAAPDNVITRNHVALLSAPSGERIIWGMTNLLGERRIPAAMAFFREQLERGEEPYAIWSILLNMVKNLVLVWACMQEGIRDQSSVARELKLSPFVIRGVWPLATSLRREQVQWLTRFMAESDIALKSGGYKYTVEHQEEVIALIERSMLACA